MPPHARAALGAVARDVSASGVNLVLGIGVAGAGLAAVLTLWLMRR